MRKLQLTANIFVILTALVVCGATVYDRVGPLEKRPTAIGIHDKLVGNPLPIPALRTGKHFGNSATLVLFVSTTCHFCEESMPFYKRLSSIGGAGKGDFKMVAAFPQGLKSIVESDQFFSAHGFSPDFTLQVDYSVFGQMATPTLVLLDNSAVAKDVWVGRLTSKGERSVEAAIRGLCRSCVLPGA